MDLIKEKTLKETYAKLLEVGFGDGAIEEMTQFIAEDVMGYGTALDEKIMSIEGFIELVHDQRKQSKDFDDFRYTSNPVVVRLAEKGQSAVIVDEIELLTVIEGKSNTLPLRMSTVMEIKDGAWKVTHWHGSLAEHVSDGDDPWHVSEWKQKTEKLERMVEEKTADLAQKNRELEIESALERVRAMAMSMRKPDDLLDVCKTISEQLELLQVKDIRNVQVAIIDEARKNYLNYQYFTPYKEKVFEVTAYENHPASKGMVTEMQKSANSFFTGHMKGKDLEGFRDWRKKFDQFPDPLLDKSSAVFYYFYSIGPGGLGLTTYNEIAASSLDIFKRFHKVFTLSYRRYQDIAKAEEQAREAQVEAGLERLRNKAMTIQSSHELSGLINTVFMELGKLDMVLTRCILWVFRAKDQSATVWMANAEDPDHADSYFVDKHDHPAYKEYIKAWKKREPKWVYHLKGKNKARWDHILVDGYLGRLPRQVREAMKEPEQVILSGSFNKYGVIQTASLDSLSDENLEILHRFSQVFEQTYTRFLDLQKAEVQAREAQVELALERIRARTMAMQRSDELAEAAFVLFLQFRELGEDPDQLTIGIVNEAEKVLEVWLSVEEKQMDRGFRISIEEPVVVNKIYQGWKKRKSTLVLDISGDDLKKYNDYRKKDPDFNDYNLIRESDQKKENRRVIHCAFFRRGMLSLATPVPRPDETVRILERFAAVFDQTYTRFLDLQKAEAQAREAQVELALERIRAKVTAMNESAELLDIVVTMRSEFVALGHEAHYFWYMRYLPDTYEKAMTSGDGARIGMVMTLPRHIHGDIKLLADWEKSDEPTVVFPMDVETAVDYVDKMINLGDFQQVDPNAPTLDDIRHIGGLTFIMARTTYGEIGYSLPGYVPDPPREDLDTLVRFAAVFDLAYRRFEDLQRAEQQNRETQIELALERVRSKTMAMHNSQDVGDTVVTLFNEVLKLGLDKSIRVGIGILEGYEGMETWSATSRSDGKVDLKMGMLDMTIHPMLIGLKKAWKSGETRYHYDFLGEDVFRYYRALNNEPEYPFKADLDALPENEYHKSFFYAEGILFSFAPNPISDEAANVLDRFARVFGQTYRRYRDLQKAEAQAREAQIEAALERVRSRSMGMQKSEELKEVIQVVYDQFVQLDIFIEHTGFIIDYKERDDMLIWLADKQGVPAQITIPYFDSPHWNSFLEAREKGFDFFANDLDFEEKNSFYKKLFTYIPGLPENIKETYFNCPALSISTVLMDNVGLYIENFEGTPYSDEENMILKRFGTVFQQTYTRFRDLKRSEEQAREAQIDAALERVRSRTMGMQKSEELADVVADLFSQLDELGIKTYRCNLGIIGTKDRHTYLWSTTNEGKVIPIAPHVPLTENNYLKRIYNGWKKQGDPVIDRIVGKKRIEWTNYINKYVDFKEYDPKNIDMERIRREPAILQSFFFRQGFFTIHTIEDLEKEAFGVIQRFAHVFEQTYTRFLDLQRAESQAREALIEAALERVRSQAMAMHNSEDLSLTVNTFFTELKGLNVTPHRCGVGIVDDRTRIVRIHATDTNQEKEGKKIVGDLKLEGHPVLDQIFQHWKLQKDYFPVLRGKEIKEYYQVMNPQVAFHEFTEDEIQYGYYFNFKEGGVYAWTDVKLHEQDIQIFKRFTSVLSLTYRRYMDLIDAENQAREAIKQSSLDRVRGEIASMRNTEDLQQITPLIWRELKTLEIPFFRCGVFIVNEIRKHVNVYLTTPDGKPLGALDLAFSANDLTRNTVESWRNKEVYQQHWNREEFIQWTQEMIKLGQIKVPEKYQGAEKPPESLHLHFIPFAQGMLYVGHTEQLDEPQIDLIKALSDAFSYAYARYQDFVILEEAKVRMEKTLNDLKATQSQLIHAEKMASLGELTAGIAHEIQNPLNFVNNFSDVSVDLLEEMKEEAEAGNAEEVRAILEDLKQNLDKIHHHGKRASGIVRGMLEHSRAGSGQKDPADINALADEYLRLAYHGLRAKDKSFNAEFSLDAEEELPAIKVVGQDIGRVLLNLINNAFYAVSDKARNTKNGFKPRVDLKTKSNKETIEISVKDNGNGIPKKVLEKIFQPFFTTKPTGEGTGLGLSLSYDIITKGHGGEMKVKTTVGEGTEFIIILPIDQE
jgi:signal transduction histidine kinase